MNASFAWLLSEYVLESAQHTLTRLENERATFKEQQIAALMQPAKLLGIIPYKLTREDAVAHWEVDQDCQNAHMAFKAEERMIALRLALLAQAATMGDPKGYMGVSAYDFVAIAEVYNDPDVWRQRLMRMQAELSATEPPART